MADHQNNHCASPPTRKLFVILIAPVIYSIFLYQNSDFNAGPLPKEHSFDASILVPEKHNQILAVSERIGEGSLHGPEDLAYDPKSRFLYTGCVDGWIRRVELVGDGKFKVEDWVQTSEHGRPLGVVLGLDGSLIIADANEVGLISFFIIDFSLLSVCARRTHRLFLSQTIYISVNEIVFSMIYLLEVWTMKNTQNGNFLV
jgi:Adipocyte plasma membrane-associated protein-like, N-terminal